MISKDTSIPTPLINASILVIIFLVGLVVSEFIVRGLYKDTAIIFPRYHTDAQYSDFTIRRIRPNSKFIHTSIDGSWKFTINKQGFRNYEDFEYKKPKDLIRVVSLGDSHTQGFEVNQDFTYSRIIEKYLRRNKINIEVFNAGVSGFSTAEELVLLENELIKYKPDFVVLGFFANDFQDNINCGIFGLDDKNELIVKKKMHIPGVKIQNFIYSIPGVQWLSENSYFYSILFNNVWEFFKKRLKTKSNLTEMAIRTEKTFLNYEINLAGELIKRMYSVSKRAGAKLIIMDIPQKKKDGRIKPSVIPALAETVTKNSDKFISNNVLSDFSGVAKMHVLHGHRHISELTHAILGLESAKYIENIIRNESVTH